jgi:DnaJ-class molecular chaperone
MKDLPPSVHTTRAIRRFQCSKCSGAGGQSLEVTSQCEVCRGRGWIEPERGAEQLCPKCKGFQVTPVVQRASCGECDGKGYVVALVEIMHEEKKRELPCRRCKGTGAVIVLVEVDSDDCERCGGSGVDFDEAARGVAMEEARCPDCGGGRKARGIRREERECPKCHGRGRCGEAYIEEVVRIVSTGPDTSHTQPPSS